MTRVDADRNLLLGLLALQNNFIDRGALLDAFNRWVHDRAIPLGQILRDRGALKPDEHDLIQALVVKHMEKFGGDPERSLQHLSTIGSVREDLSRIADPDLQASLAQVAVARADDDPYRAVSQVSPGESSSIGSRFRVLRPHAKGGLGQVSVALDQELDRPVALKEIQDHHADEPLSRARFVQEAEITGKLDPDHPPTLQSRNNLAEAYRVAGRNDEAIKLHEATLKLRESKLGPDHPTTLTSRNNLANAYFDAGRTAEALMLHEVTLNLRVCPESWA